MPKKLLIFDFDGTIADSMEQTIEIINGMADEYKIPRIDRANIPSLKNLSSRDFLKKFHISFWKLPFLLSSGKKRFNERIIAMKPIPGIEGALISLKEKYKLGILTSNSRENVEKFLRNSNLEFFDFISGESSLFGKARGIRKIARENGFAKGNIYYIGDETRDVDAANKAEVNSIAVSWGFNSREILAQFNPDYLVDSPEELLKVLG